MQIIDLKRKDFNFTEFFDSNTLSSNQQEFYKLPIDIQNEYLKNATILADKIQEIRDFLQCPISISSGWRSPKLNKMVGGQAKSQHLIFQAIDWQPVINGVITKQDKILTEILIKMKEAKIVVDQCLMEGSWIHTSIKANNNRNEFATYRIGKNGKRNKLILK